MASKTVNIYRSILLSISCCFTSMQADFSRYSMWHRTSLSGKKQYLVCCGEGDHKKTEHAQEQANALVALLKQRDCLSDCIVLEDMADYEGACEYAKQYAQHMNLCSQLDVQDIQKRYDDLYDQNALRRVAQAASGKNINVINIEHRHFRQKIECASDSWQKLFKKLDAFVVSSLLKEIQHYDDGVVLNKHYKSITDRLSPLVHALNRECCLGDIMHKIVRGDDIGCGRIRLSDLWPDRDSIYFEHYQGALRDIASAAEQFDRLLQCELFDARLLHILYHMQVKRNQSNTIFVCAGDTHISSIQKLLSQLGYTYIPCEGQQSLDTILNKVSSAGNRLQAKL